MKTLYRYILESYDDSLRLSKNDKKKLLELDKEFGSLIVEFDKCQPYTKLLNFKEEIDKYIDSYDSAHHHYPKFKHDDSKFTEDKKQYFLDKASQLISRFKAFNNCYLSKFYIDRLNGITNEISSYEDHVSEKSTVDYTNDPLYIEALKVIEKHPYEAIDDDKRNIPADEVISRINDKLEEFGYEGWTCQKSDNEIIRVTVSLFDHCVKVSDHFKYSEEDIEGLIQHEAFTHVGRKYYGEQTGLELFKCGLSGRSSLDEGLAIWCSLNKVSKPKQNILFNCAMRYVICSQLPSSTFDGLVNTLQTMAPKMKFEKVVSVIGRCLREFDNISNDNLRLGCYGDDRMYFKGYMFVKGLSDEERDDALRYNIGIKDFDSLDTIKKFLKINGFTHQ